METKDNKDDSSNLQNDGAGSQPRSRSMCRILKFAPTKFPFQIYFVFLVNPLNWWSPTCWTKRRRICVYEAVEIGRQNRGIGVEQTDLAKDGCPARFAGCRHVLLHNWEVFRRRNVPVLESVRSSKPAVDGLENVSGRFTSLKSLDRRKR
jgi:hypothetical protein